MASPKTVQISGTGGSATLNCDNCVYPFIGRQVTRDTILHTYRDGDTSSAGNRAQDEIEVRPHTSVGERLQFQIPYASAAIETLIFGFATSLAGTMQIVDDYGTRVFAIEICDSKPRTNLNGFFEISMQLLRVS